MGRLAFIQLYLLDEQGHTFHTQQAGTFAKWPTQQLSPDGYGLHFTLPPRRTQTVWVAVRSSGFFKSGFLLPRLFAPNTYRNLKEHLFLARWPLLAFYGITIGFLLFGAIFTLFQYVARRDGFLVAYAGVAFLLALTVIRLADYNLEIRTLSTIIPFLYAYLTPINFGLGACYLLFIRLLLRFGEAYPGLHTWVQRVTLGFGFLSILFAIVSPSMAQSTFWSNLNSTTMSVLSSILVLGFTLAIVLFLFIRQVPLSGYLLAGLGCIALGIVGMVILNQFPTVHTRQETFWQVPSVYMSLGMIGEMLCFSLALGERARRDESERLTLIHRKQVLESEAAQLMLDLQQAVREAEEALLRGQSEERRRVATELHDLLGGTLTALRFRVLALNSTKLLLEQSAEYSRILAMLDEASQQLRQLSHNLLPDGLHQRGLLPTLQNLLGQLTQLSPVCFEFLANADELPLLDKKTQFTLYAICLELCQNTLKHAQATRASLELFRSEQTLELIMSDNGRGFSPNSVTKGMGLSNLQERAGSIGATIRILSPDEGGTLVHLRMPISPISLPAPLR